MCRADAVGMKDVICENHFCNLNKNYGIIKIILRKINIGQIKREKILKYEIFLGFYTDEKIVVNACFM